MFFNANGKYLSNNIYSFCIKKVQMNPLFNTFGGTVSTQRACGGICWVGGRYSNRSGHN